MTAVPFQAQQSFGQYTLIRPLAVGGMAEVWLAKLDGPQGFQKKVALKRMTGTIAEQPHFVAMFLDEARLMSGLTHPNICQVFELGQREDNFYVAMEFIDGQTVQHVLRAVTRSKQRLPVELALKIARDAADALYYAHTKLGEDGKPLQVIHRDVSPQNVMVTYEGVAKLLDFGIAKAVTRTNATEVGQLKGKLSYMPPEQARGETLDARADQFSLGVLMFEMLTHSRLYPPLKEMDLFRKVALEETPYETCRERDPSVPEELSELVARMMSRDPAKRFPSLAEVRDAIAAYLHEHTNSIPSNEALAHFMLAFFPVETREQVMSPGTSGPSLPVVLGAAPGGRGWRMATIGLVVMLGTVTLAAALWPRTVEPVLEEEVVVPPASAASVIVPDAVPAFVLSPPPMKAVRQAPVQRGMLSLQTSPWSNVIFGKKNLGETPLVGIPFPVGRHRLVLVNDEKKLKTTIEVEIRANETTTLKLKL